MDRVADLGGLQEMLATLNENGVRFIITTVTYRCLALAIMVKYMFEAVSGFELEQINDRLTGLVVRYFSEEDKITFTKKFALSHGISMESVAALGDSRSDIHLFSHVGRSIALDARPDAVAAANFSLKTDNINDVLTYLL